MSERGELDLARIEVNAEFGETPNKFQMGGRRTIQQFDGNPSMKTWLTAPLGRSRNLRSPDLVDEDRN
jgi:hypothetical protein